MKRTSEALPGPIPDPPRPASKLPEKQPGPRDAPRPAERPDVIVEFMLDGAVLLMAVRNIGSGCAHQVRVGFEPAFRGGGGEVDMSAIALFSRLEFLAPSGVISVFIDAVDLYFGRGEPEVIVCTVTFQDDVGRGFTRRIRHDLGIYLDLPRHACRVQR
jgi:hypothetical protein